MAFAEVDALSYTFVGLFKAIPLSVDLASGLFSTSFLWIYPVVHLPLYFTVAEALFVQIDLLSLKKRFSVLFDCEYY